MMTLQQENASDLLNTYKKMFRLTTNADQAGEVHRKHILCSITSTRPLLALYAETLQ